MFRRHVFVFLSLVLLVSASCDSNDGAADSARETPSTRTSDTPPSADHEAVRGAENQMRVGQTTRLSLPPVRSGKARFWKLEPQDSALIEHLDSMLIVRDKELFRYDVFKAIGVGRAQIHYVWRDTLMPDSLLEEDTTATFHLQILESQASI